jgi:hypothetical protein
MDEVSGCKKTDKQVVLAYSLISPMFQIKSQHFSNILRTNYGFSLFTGYNCRLLGDLCASCFYDK